MSFKHWLENMSTFEMISVLIGLSLTLAFIIAIFFLLEVVRHNLKMQGFF